VVKDMVFKVKLPILGFEQVEAYTLTKIDDTFMKLEANEGTEPTFTLVNPFVLKPYDFEVPNPIRILLDINEKSNILIFDIVIIATPIENSTINFIAPLIFNTDNQTMAQVILDSSKYPDFGIAEPIAQFFETQE
jgi:flagellar assembly factor FliW